MIFLLLFFFVLLAPDLRASTQPLRQSELRPDTEPLSEYPIRDSMESTAMSASQLRTDTLHDRDATRRVQINQDVNVTPLEGFPMESMESAARSQMRTAPLQNRSVPATGTRRTGDVTATPLESFPMDSMESATASQARTVPSRNRDVPTGETRRVMQMNQDITATPLESFPMDNTTMGSTQLTDHRSSQPVAHARQTVPLHHRGDHQPLDNIGLPSYETSINLEPRTNTLPRYKSEEAHQSMK